MPTFHARARRNRGAWIEPLLVDQSRKAPDATLDDLVDFIDVLGTSTHGLVALDNPAPARGYGAVLPGSSDPVDADRALARIHVLEGHGEDAYRALFSQLLVQARLVREREGLTPAAPIVVDATALAPYVFDAVAAWGGDYGVVLPAGAERPIEPEPPVDPAEPVEEAVDEQPSGPENTTGAAADAPETAERGEEGTDTAEKESEAARAAQGDLSDPEVREFFEERGVEAAHEPEPTTISAEPIEITRADAVAAEEDEPEEASPFTCLDCGRGFKTSGALGSHSRTHAVE